MMHMQLQARDTGHSHGDGGQGLEYWLCLRYTECGNLDSQSTPPHASGRQALSAYMSCTQIQNFSCVFC